MALIAWLPFVKDSRQQGLGSNINVTGTISLDNNGKLGKCLNSSNEVIINTNYSFGKVWSFCFWGYVNGNSVTSNWTQIARINDGSSNLRIEVCPSSYNNGIYCYSTHNNSGNVITSGSIASPSGGYYNQWAHFCLTSNGTTITKYMNGISVGTCAYNNNGTITGTFVLSNNHITKKNDARIYDHCLSPMEVKELSKGLVLHYPLNRGGLGPSNLIKNGFGELGTENWRSGVSVSTTDIPANQTDIKASFAGYTEEYMKIYSTHTYKFSAWIKGTATSGNTYPSLYPYDIDGNFISTYQCPEGFNLNTMTTLRQQLKAGDTKIYVNDLSQWDANSGHYYDVAAIFDYVDGTGYIWPEGTYTRNCPAFASSTEAKTNLDKTNNVITLLSAYTGPTMPAGTKLCASTYGSTYFYPLGGIKLSTIQDWTYKEGTFSGDNGRLRYAKTVTFSTYGNNRMAGIKLEDITANTLTGTIEYDCSGFCNNGEKIGALTYTSDTPKYQVSTHIGATSQKIHISELTTSGFGNSYSFAWWGKRTSNNPMFWGFSDGIRLNGMYIGTLWNTGDGSNNPLYKIGTTTQVTAPSVNVWHHYVMTGNGTKCYVYLDGELWAEAKTYKAISGTSIYINGWNSATDYCSDNTDMSDFRIYATALSASDVKSLYQNCATIDADGTIRGQIRS